MTRRGFSLVELLVTMAVVGVLGTALARLLVGNSRFVAQQEAQLDARQTSRAAMNVMATDLRMLTANGVVAASTDSVKVRVPFAFGVLCRVAGSNRIASLMPVDSMMYATSIAEGVAIRAASGSYTIVNGVTASPSANGGACAMDSIRVVPGGRLVALSATLSAWPPGALFYLFQTVRYRFGPSGDLPGRVGLFRQAGGIDQEMLAPFDAGAGFGFLVGTRLTLRATPPATLDSIEGLELRLIAESRETPPGQVEPARFALRPRIKFVNR
jgi:prepilin-type N-terminal cleavage/methylation domain-containing protein